MAHNAWGSWYYAIAGAAFLVVAWLLYRRCTEALWLYAVFVLASLVRAVWEAVFDWWSPSARGGILVLLVIWLLMPFVSRKLSDADGRAPLIFAVLASLGVAGYSMTTDPYDIAGTLSAGEWHFYGRSLYGQRYSPLDRITVDNVDKLELAWTYQTGEEKWRFDPRIGPENQRQHQTCRGVSYHKDASIAAGEACAERVYLSTSDAHLIASMRPPARSLPHSAMPVS